MICTRSFSECMHIKIRHRNFLGSVEHVGVGVNVVYSVCVCVF